MQATTQHQAIPAPSSRVFGLRVTVGLGLILLVFWTYQLLILWLWQQQLHEKIQNFDALQIIRATKQDLAKKQQTPAELPLSLSLSTIPLPPIQNSTQMAAEPLAQPPQLRPQVTFAPSPASKKSPPSEKSLSASSAKSAERVYQQLQFEPGLDLQISLPSSAKKRNALLNYLYQCAGAQFALLQENQLVYLSPQRWVSVSPWLRITSGELSPQEHQWLGSKKGETIRIFPQSIDLRLSQYIADALQGQALKSFRASYIMGPDYLGLSNIMLNNQNVTGTWSVHQSSCTK